MQAFTAVITTGIYCRPGCPARPMTRNTRRFPLAAAAEAAGYRACLRCRPYRVPPAVDPAQPQLVCRAVRLILAGALDEGLEEALAGRLGVSSRHLRRLFVTHLGVTPDGLARSARAHFARRLLDDTDLTITEIAYAAGFGSLRQFNRVCREVFRASPSDLRSKRRQADRLVADGGLALRLAVPGSIDWPAMTACLAETATPGVESVREGVYRRTVLIAGDPGVLELAFGDLDHLILRIHLPHWEELLHVVHRARRIAGLDLDLEEPVRHLSRDPIVGPLIRARAAIRIPGTWDAFETGVRAIIAQDIAGDSASAVMERIVEAYGRFVPGVRELGLTHLFPQPGVLARAEVGGHGLSGATGATVRAFARAVNDGTIRLDGGAGLDELVASMRAVPGVGAWAAHQVALRLGESDAYPMHAHGDVAEQWRPWRALAVTHLWTAGRSRAHLEGAVR